MFDNFSKIDYFLSGQTVEVTDIFKSIKLDFTDFLGYSTRKNEKGLRPDQFSNQVYSDPKLFWTILLANDIKNPFKDWSQGQATLVKQNEAEYDSYVFQFANNSKYLPGNTLYYQENVTDAYLGISLDNIQEDDIIVYSLGNNSDRFTSFGAGQIASEVSCGYPHYGQALIPQNFLNRNNTIKTSASGSLTAAIVGSSPTASGGNLYVWGEPVGLTKNGMTVQGRLYSYGGQWNSVDVANNKVLASGLNNVVWYCWGDGCTGTLTYPVGEQNLIKKLAFTKGNAFSGLVLLDDNTLSTYGGITATFPNITFSDIACTNNYCLGIVADAGVDEGKVIEFNYTGTPTPIVPAIGPKVTKLACGRTHSLLLDETGTIHTIGTNEKGRLDLPTDKVYTDIGAGEYFSAAIDSDQNLILSGEILQNSGSCSGSTAYIPITTIDGKYDKLACGDNHVICIGSGTSKQYFGRVTRVDNDYKRIFVKAYTAPDLNTVNFTDPSGTNITVFRNNNLIKNIQHQLYSIDSYVNTPQYITNTENTVIDVKQNNGEIWKTDYILNYKNAENLPQYITPIKLKIEKINTDIKLVNLDKLYTLQTLLTDQFRTENKIYIKMSDL